MDRRVDRAHVHCAVELPSHFDACHRPDAPRSHECSAVALENRIRGCWAKVEWGHGRILVRDGTNAGWINYMLKDRQKSESPALDPIDY